MRHSSYSCSRRADRPRAGFTFLEASIALALLSLVLVNVGMVMKSSTAAYESGASLSDLDAQADRTMDRIALALMSSSKDSVVPLQATPTWTRTIEYQQNIGVEEGKAIWSDPERIECILQDGQVVWKQNPDLSNERRVVWTNWVRDFIEGELANGIDDNGNGLVDESGLAFAFGANGKTVTIRLTLERMGPGGRRMTRTLETLVTLRN